MPITRFILMPMLRNCGAISQLRHMFPWSSAKVQLDIFTLKRGVTIILLGVNRTLLFYLFLQATAHNCFSSFLDNNVVVEFL